MYADLPLLILWCLTVGRRSTVNTVDSYRALLVTMSHRSIHHLLPHYSRSKTELVHYERLRESTDSKTIQGVFVSLDD